MPSRRAFAPFTHQQTAGSPEKSNGRERGKAESIAPGIFLQLSNDECHQHRNGQEGREKTERSAKTVAAELDRDRGTQQRPDTAAGADEHDAEAQERQTASECYE